MEERNIEKSINYDEIKQMEEHAKKYEDAFDKKDFLRNISAYEQKIILLNSQHPYEVLNYLDELDLKNSRQILSELNFDEIKNILELFTAEDKKDFYKSFSDLSLVNQFIVQDKASSNYIKDLSFDRKVDLIDSSNKETVMASAKIYETMPEEERIVVAESVTTSNSISTLSEAAGYVESNEINSDVVKLDSTTNESNELDNLNENELMKVEETNKEIIEEVKDELMDKMLKSEQLEEQQENKKEELTPEEKQLQVGETEELTPEERNLNITAKIDNNDSLISDIESSSFETPNEVTLEQFQSVKQQTEQNEIEKIKQSIIKPSIEQNIEESVEQVKEQEPVKTL